MPLDDVVQFGMEFKSSHDTELVVDQFAGGGGASTGIEEALGRPVDIAINHDEEAVALHYANHPRTEHFCESVYDVDPISSTRGRPIGLLWLSPDCKHFSKAKGGALVSRRVRGLAWMAKKWAGKLAKVGRAPRVIMLENVEEFITWGPLSGPVGAQKPDPKRKGLYFRRWVRDLRKLGYQVEWRELRACDYGAPTIRKRLFVICRRDNLPIIWPEPTHAAPEMAARLGLLPWRTAAECIDWWLPCPSIFLSKEEGRAIGVNRPLADNTMERIFNGVRKYVIEAAEPYIVTCNHGKKGFRGQSTRKPKNTVTAARDAHGLVMPSIARIGQTGGKGKYAASAAAPLSTIVSKAEHLVVAAHGQVPWRCNSCHETFVDEQAELGTLSPPECPRCGEEQRIERFAPLITSGFGGPTSADARKRSRPAAAPLPTTTTRATQTQLVMPMITPTFVGVGGRAGQSPPRGGEQPFATSTTKADLAVVAPYMVPRYGERPGQEPRTRSVQDPLATVVTTGNEGSLVAPMLHAASSAEDNENLTAMAGFMAQQNTGVVGHSAHEPVSTVVGKGCTQTPVAVYLKRDFGGSVGHGANDPAGTSTAGGGGKTSLVAAHLTNFYSSSATGGEGRVKKPFKTVTSGGQHIAEVRAFLAKYYGTGGQDQGADGPMHTATTRGRFGLVTVAGHDYQIVDIGMRMLTPRELYRAQGFPETYLINIEYKGKPLSKVAQIRMCGNSVCPPLAKALVIANFMPEQRRMAA